jgi:hypothetical protein
MHNVLTDSLVFEALDLPWKDRTFEERRRAIAAAEGILVIGERWIQHPQQTHPGTAMPELNVTPRDAEEIAQCLEELR